MSEEEKKAIEQLREVIKAEKITKLEKEIEALANGIRVLGTNPDITTEEIIKEFTEKPISEEYMEKFKNSYISKDKILKAIGYEENYEEYDRLKQDDEKLLTILDTLYSEVCRLEDIEDKKVEVAVDFIEEKRDKYWEDKIRKILLKFQNEYGEDLETTDQLFIGKEVIQYGEDMLDEIAKELDIKLLEEN